LLAAARSLTAFANAAGGSDNITVALAPVGAG
jgi:serine/threonine protein phosphatase PrpC